MTGGGARGPGGGAPAPGGAGPARGGAGPGLRDAEERWPVAGQRKVSGAFVTLRTDEVRMPDGEVVPRDVVEHPGAVAVVALDGAGRVLLIRQYRHAAGRLLWEIPAGLRDVPGEPLLSTAKRELREEAGYAAGQWHVLTDCFTSPGILGERLRVFLARDLAGLAESQRGAPLEHEEAYLVTAWVPLEAAVRLLLGGELHNGVAAIGILAAYAARQGGFGSLRETGAPED